MNTRIVIYSLLLTLVLLVGSVEYEYRIIKKQQQVMSILLTNNLELSNMLRQCGNAVSIPKMDLTAIDEKASGVRRTGGP